MEAQAAILKILHDNSVKENPEDPDKVLEWIKQISCSSLFFKIESFPAVIVEDAEPAFESYRGADQAAITSEKQFVNVAVIIKSANTNENGFTVEDYMEIKSELKTKADAVKSVLMEQLQEVSGVFGGEVGAASIHDTTIDAEPAMMCIMPFTVIIIK
jgi:hypothetical protein